MSTVDSFGSKDVLDVDGTEYVDMHGGYGASIAGHAHPAIVAAVSEQVRRGTHFAQPTEDAIWIAGELARRLPLQSEHGESKRTDGHKHVLYHASGLESTYAVTPA